MQSESFDRVTWNQLIRSMPGAHFLQTWEWAQVKSRYGWEAIPYTWSSSSGSTPNAAAMILKRRIPTGGFGRKMCLLYIPKGPLLDWQDAPLRQHIMESLQEFARRQGAIFVKMDPDVVTGKGIPGKNDASEEPLGQKITTELSQHGWRASQDQIQFKNTVLIDLTPTEDDLLARMKQKTRYNIHLAEKKGVRVRVGSSADLPLLYRFYAQTSLRDGFVIRDEKYYQLVWNTFMHEGDPHAVPLIAEVDGVPVAAIFQFIFGARAYYLYGMSSGTHREKMPNHLLQWEAIRRAKSAGCTTYDLWGAPEEFVETDSMWGVFRFKEGFAGQVIRTMGAWDFTPSPLLYKLYTQAIPRLLDIMRARGRGQTQQSLG